MIESLSTDPKTRFPFLSGRVFYWSEILLFALKFSQEVGKYILRHKKWVSDFSQPIDFAVAGVTRLELATFPS